METEFSRDTLSSLLDELALLSGKPADELKFDATLLEELLIDEVADIPSDEAPPRVCVVGRAGVGKSSLINTLARETVAEVGTVRPTTTNNDQTIHEITLGDNDTLWEVVDFRGLLESAPPDGAESADTIKTAIEGLTNLNPDLVLHVTTADYVRGGRDSIEVINELGSSIPGGAPPRIICINKVDDGAAADWPPTANPGFNERMEELLDLVEQIVSSRRTSELRDGDVLRGVLFESSEIIAAIPICAESSAHWNRQGVVSLLTEYLQDDDRFREFRERRQRQIGRRCAQIQTATMATAVHNLPNSVVTDETRHVVPILQRYLVALIGAFSGQELTGAPVEDYFPTVEPFDTEVSDVVSYTEELIGGDSSLESTIPAITDTLARSGMPRMEDSLLDRRVAEAQGKLTYMIGRSAEQYFFEDSVKSPQRFASEADDQLCGIYVDASGPYHRIVRDYFDS